MRGRGGYAGRVRPYYGFKETGNGMADVGLRNDATRQEVWAILGELSASQRETDRRMQETDRLMRKTPGASANSTSCSTVSGGS